MFVVIANVMESPVTVCLVIFDTRVLAMFDSMIDVVLRNRQQSLNCFVSGSSDDAPRIYC